MSVLTAQGLSVNYGGVHALSDVSFDIGPGELVGLIGPNGAGKTTCIDALTGFTRSKGEVFLGGKNISGLSPHRRARAGMARTFQSAELFVDLTVQENVAVPLGQTALSMGKELFTGIPAKDGAAEEILEMLGIGHLAALMPDQLTLGQRKLVGVARALVRSPAVVCLDEPAAGLDTSESEKFGKQISRLAEAGQSMLLVDHDMGLVMSVCDKIVVLNFGQVIAVGTPDEIKNDPGVMEAYLGTSTQEPDDAEAPAESAQTVVSVSSTTPEAAKQTVLLELSNLSAGYNGYAAVRNVDLEVRSGEVVALLGPNGAGKTTTLRAVSRLIGALDGQVRFLGEPIHEAQPHHLPQRGLLHVPEDRGVFFALTVAEHFRSTPGKTSDIDVAFAYFPALTRLKDRKAGLLSGGEQQMLAVSLALSRKPKVLLLDELSHGLAPVIVQELLPVIRTYAEETGAGVLLVEQHVPLALQISDRAYVLAHGEPILSGTAAQLRADERLLMASYLGERSTDAAVL
ncbi:ATP-binding cassette domain-containing protein [Nocardia miyunensis]|uniref:ATP-binding cassette domain-containing protein n=1 Tax=Nocardia miyunensis TaxID=282684 RepID=UPI00083503A4|nr:ATP-binding cassette domain-containing protein [Nocardia miyunensis]